jgi:shikimate dehydrogenase
MSNLIINTTPLGMFPDIDSFPDINYDALTKSHILFDLVYNPEMTKFLLKGKERGCRVKGGIEMLHLQAERSWIIWNDPDI